YTAATTNGGSMALGTDLQFVLYDDKDKPSLPYSAANYNADGLIDLNVANKEDWHNKAVKIQFYEGLVAGDHVVLLHVVEGMKWPLKENGKETDCVMVDPSVSGMGAIDLSMWNESPFARYAAGAHIVSNPDRSGQYRSRVLLWTNTNPYLADGSLAP